MRMEREERRRGTERQGGRDQGRKKRQLSALDGYKAEGTSLEHIVILTRRCD